MLIVSGRLFIRYGTSGSMFFCLKCFRKPGENPNAFAITHMHYPYAYAIKKSSPMQSQVT